MRQAIWRKADAGWPVCGIPDMLYVDHGSDFTSRHLDQVAVALRFQVVYSAVGRPQGRGKVERLFGTLNTELLPELPGHLIDGKPATARSLAELDRAVGAFVAGTYHARVHAETGETPLDAWRGGGFLPRLPDSLEDLYLTNRRLKRGVFTSIVELQAAINRFVAETNQQPKPFVWTADPNKIIAAVRRGHQTLDLIH